MKVHSSETQWPLPVAKECMWQVSCSQGTCFPVCKTLPNKIKNKSPYSNIVSALDLRTGHMPENQQWSSLRAHIKGATQMGWQRNSGQETFLRLQNLSSGRNENITDEIVGVFYA